MPGVWQSSRQQAGEGAQLPGGGAHSKFPVLPVWVPVASPVTSLGPPVTRSLGFQVALEARDAEPCWWQRVARGTLVPRSKAQLSGWDLPEQGKGTPRRVQPGGGGWLRELHTPSPLPRPLATHGWPGQGPDGDWGRGWGAMLAGRDRDGGHE